MNNVTMNYQPLRSSLRAGKALSFKSDVHEKAQEKADNRGKPAGIRTKMSLFNIVKKTGEGMLSPFTSIINGGAGAIMLAVGGGAATNAALNTNVGRKMRPVVMAVLGLFGAAKIVQGADNVIKNKGNAEKQEECFKDIGQGGTAVILSLIGAKPALGAADSTIKAETLQAMNPLKALYTCGKNSGRYMKEAAEAAKLAARNMSAGAKSTAIASNAGGVSTVVGVSDAMLDPGTPNTHATGLSDTSYVNANTNFGGVPDTTMDAVYLKTMNTIADKDDAIMKQINDLVGAGQEKD